MPLGVFVCTEGDIPIYEMNRLLEWRMHVSCLLILLHVFHSVLLITVSSGLSLRYIYPLPIYINIFHVSSFSIYTLPIKIKWMDRHPLPYKLYGAFWIMRKETPDFSPTETRIILSSLPHASYDMLLDSLS